jgi:hypothetical protein
MDRQIEARGYFMRMVIKVLFLSLVLSSSANATPNVGAWGHVNYLGGGWTNADLRVQMDIAFYNPESCSFTDGYMVNNADGGHELFSSLLITAYTLHQQVQLVVDGCYFSRPHIIGVYVKP